MGTIATLNSGTYSGKIQRLTQTEAFAAVSLAGKHQEQTRQKVFKITIGLPKCYYDVARPTPPPPLPPAATAPAPAPAPPQQQQRPTAAATRKAKQDQRKHWQECSSRIFKNFDTAASAIFWESPWLGPGRDHLEVLQLLHKVLKLTHATSTCIEETPTSNICFMCSLHSSCIFLAPLDCSVCSKR